MPANGLVKGAPGISPAAAVPVCLLLVILLLDIVPMSWFRGSTSTILEYAAQVVGACKASNLKNFQNF